MKPAALLILFLSVGLACFSQSNEFEIYFHNDNTIKPKIDTIDAESFFRIRRVGVSSGPVIQSIYLPEEINRAADSIWKSNKLNKEKKRQQIDSIVRVMKEKYPSAFNEDDSCLILNCSDKKIELCHHKSANIKAQTSYSFIDFEKNYLIIEKSGYESWEYILFNPQTRNYAYFEFPPFFINDSIAYCSDNYYGSGGFQIRHLSGKFYFGFGSDSWELEECYRIDKVFYFSFRLSYTSKAKYLRIDFNDCF